MHIHFWQLHKGISGYFLFKCVFVELYTFVFAVTFSMPPRKNVTGVLTSMGENHWSKPNANHISMHSEGTQSSSEAGHLENRNVMAAIKDHQRFQAAMWVEFQSLC